MKSLGVVVTGTGFEGRAARIRAFCREGSEVQLRREPNNPHDRDAIAVWLRCKLFFGLWRPWAQIGYIKAARADSWATKIDSGEMKVQRAYVRSMYAPRGREHPRVSLTVEFE